MTTNGQARHFFSAFRVFVFGAEITEDVVSVSVTHNDARAPSTAEIVLANKDNTNGIEDRYILTQADIFAMRTDTPEEIKTLKLPEKEPVLAAVSSELLRVENDKKNAIALAENSAVADEETQAIIRARIELFAEEEAQLQQQFGDLAAQQGVEIVASTEALADNVKRQVLANLQSKIVDPVKQKVLVTKVGEVQDIGSWTPAFGGEELAATIADIAALRGKATRYPMQIGDCIFHSNDPVRIFYREPRSGSGTWYHMFAGFITDWVDDVDENNTKTVTLRCEDVLRTFRYARISTSPGLIDIDAVAIDTDLILRTFNNDDFREFTLPEFLFTMIFGFNTANTVERAVELGNILDVENITGKRTKKLIGANMKAPVYVTLNKDGVAPMSISRSLICILGQGNVDATTADLSTVSTLLNLEVPLDSLGVYQAVVDHEVRVTDLKSMAVEAPGASPITVTRKDPNTGQTSIDEVIKAIGEHPEIYPVDGGRFIMLAPSTMGIGYNTGQLFQDFKGVELKSSFKTRLEKMYAVLEHIEFSLYANGRGDIIAEMPLHDFDPREFGDKVITASDLAASLGKDRAETILDSSHTAGPFAAHYHVSASDTVRWSRSFNDEQIKTLVFGGWYNIPSVAAGQTSDVVGQEPARRLLPSLIPMFGARAEEVPPTINITDKARAELYCQLLLNRFNGDARQAQVEAIPMLRVMPNRPLLFTERTFVGTTREVTQSITWGERGDMSMRFKVNYLRGWDGSRDKDTGRPFYSYFGGYRANPQDYALLLKNQQPSESLAELRAPNKGTPPGDEEGS